MNEDQLLALMAAQIAGGYAARGTDPEFAVRMSVQLAREIRQAALAASGQRVGARG